MTQDKTVFELFKEQAKEKAQAISVQMAYRQCDTLLDYHYQCGIVRGLNDAIAILEDVITDILKKGD